jgi:hypothetical protein
MELKNFYSYHREQVTEKHRFKLLNQRRYIGSFEMAGFCFHGCRPSIQIHTHNATAIYIPDWKASNAVICLYLWLQLNLFQTPKY